MKFVKVRAIPCNNQGGKTPHVDPKIMYLNVDKIAAVGENGFIKYDPGQQLLNLGADYYKDVYIIGWPDKVESL
ncbi:hypothetical protein LXM25_05900 [Dyadobacter sp. LJ53]|uniref:hypothetical protein n=1 Tax=Dyadobacter chenwenxiniae TaxID=2906456 RepID=UPI001F42DFF4|nr:hypothetical protein [Dyadobacter chenwenxiniae]MCF0049577.1 hypothetical protein [Dyadobacter chenwenxiniae]